MKKRLKYSKSNREIYSSYNIYSVLVLVILMMLVNIGETETETEEPKGFELEAVNVKMVED